MDNQTAYLFVFDGFADWEPASALAELRRTFGFSVQTVGLTRDPVKSMGGLKILPDLFSDPSSDRNCGFDVAESLVKC